MLDGPALVHLIQVRFVDPNDLQSGHGVLTQPSAPLIWRLDEDLLSAATERLPISAMAMKRRGCRSALAPPLAHACQAWGEAYKDFFKGITSA